MSDARTPLVLLHGWGMTPRVWHDLAARLDGRFRLVTPALPGHRGRPLPHASTLDSWADSLAPDLPDGAFLCGWSLGAMVAIKLAVRHPQKVRRLVLTGATPRFVAADDWPHGLDAATVEAFVRGFAEAPAVTLRRFLSLQVQGESHRKVVQASLAAALARTADADGAADAALAEGLRVLVETDLRADLPQLRQPVLLIHGDGDALMPLQAAGWLAQALPDARLEPCRNSGHAPFLSDPAAFADQLLAFADV